MRVSLFIVGIIGIILLPQCKLSPNSIVVLNQPHEKLSEYNFFKGDLASLEPNDGVIPYDLNSPLFSDYTEKARFVWMPKGQSAKYTTDHVLDFPKGAVLIKNFYFNNDERDVTKGRKIIETRLLVNREEEWEAYAYIWNKEQTDAQFEIVGDVQEISWIDATGTKKNVQYIIPNKNQCKGCHAYKKKQLPIGPKVRNLNKEFLYVGGTMNQLQKWSEVGYLSGYSDTVESPKVAVWDDQESYNLHDRAMAYLDINCGHCHNPNGAANTSGLTLLADSELGLPLGIYKATVSAGAGTGGHAYSIVPGHPETSIMVYRMKSTNPGAMMPELGRQLVHSEGVKLIADWISAMDPDQYVKPSTTKIN